MTTNLALASITGAGLTRTLGDRFSDIYNVKDFGALGDGSNNDTTAIQNCFDAAFGPAGSPHSATTPELNKAVFFPNGIYKVSGNPALTCTSVKSGLIFGTGMWSSRIVNSTNGAATLLLNGFEFSCMRDLGIFCTSSGSNIGLDYDSHISGNSQSSAFINCYFTGNDGTSNNANGIGVRCGHSGNQIDTTVWINCFFSGNLYGFNLDNAQNGLDQQFFGGQVQICVYGIYIQNGAMSLAHGTFFGGNSGYDINIAGGANEAVSIVGCRSESTNFLNAGGGSAIIHVHGTHQGAAALGHFVTGGTNVSIDSCWPSTGDIFMSGSGSGSGNITISNSVFNRFDALDTTAITCSTFIKNVTIGDQIGGLGRFIPNQTIIHGVTRTLDVEAADVTSDLNFLYDNYLSPNVQSYLNNAQPTTGTSVTFTNANPTVLTFPNVHNFQGGEPVAFTIAAGGTLPLGITSGRTYFVTADALTNNFGVQTTCHLSDTQAHALAGTDLIGTTSTGTSPINTWIVRKWEVGDVVTNNAPSSGNPLGWVCTTAGWASSVNAGETQAVFKPLPNLP